MFAKWFKWMALFESHVPSPRSNRCAMCGRQLSRDDDPLSGDCGGDCWGCIGKIEADLGWEPSVEFVRKEILDGLRDGRGEPRSSTRRSGHKAIEGGSVELEPKLSALHAIMRLLRDEWDPIGMMPHLPADEYDSYANRVFSMLSAGASVEEVANYLSASEMTGAPDLDRDFKVAQKAVLIMNSRNLP
jgi:hypothetical protein